MNCKWCAKGECWTHKAKTRSLVPSQIAAPSPMQVMMNLCMQSGYMVGDPPWHGSVAAAAPSAAAGVAACKWCAQGQCWTHGTSGTTSASSRATPLKPLSSGKVRVGFRGDSLLMTRADGERKRKFKSFQAELESAFYSAFAERAIDYYPHAGASVREIAKTIRDGPHFEILCVGLGVNDLLDPKTEKVLAHYPEHLDDSLRSLAEALGEKSTKSLVLLAGAASIWHFPAVWDSHVEHMHETLAETDATVVPGDEASAVMHEMPLNSDGMHFLNDEDSKAFFAEAWVKWLHEYCGVLYYDWEDPTGGEQDDQVERARSRSPRR